MASHAGVVMTMRASIRRARQRSPGRYKCQLPCIRMWDRRKRSPVNSISRCFPRAAAPTTVRPETGGRRSTTASCARSVSNAVTSRPASARCRVRAARKMVSPSGIGIGYVAYVWCDGYVRFVRFLRFGRAWRAAEVEAEAALDEAGLFEERREWVIERVLVVDR